MNKEHTAKAFILTRTAAKAARALGFSMVDIENAFHAPKKVYPSKQRPGQWRMCSHDVCLVGVFNGDKFHVITIIRNGSQALQRSAAA
jgi:hypothetical protein